MRSRKIIEGRTKLWVPAQGVYEAPVFFNPAAELSRSISVASLQVWQRSEGRKISVCDALAATGVRGIRYAREVKGIREAVMVDSNPLAVRLIRRNIRENRLKKCSAVKDDTNRYLFSGAVFDFIDIDPFGPPVQFLDSAARAVFHKGFVGITATDVAPLCGAYPDACLRKYGIRSARTDYYAELGLRIMLSNAIQAFARWDRALVPVLCFSDRHYFRVFARMGAAGEIKPLLGKFGLAEGIGPVYLGRLNDKGFCADVLREARERKIGAEALRLLATVANELDVPFYYDMHAMAKRMKIAAPPRFDKIILGLAEKGYEVSRTHFCGTAIKTNAPKEELENILKKV